MSEYLKPSKIQLIYYFLKLRFSRCFRSNRINKSMINAWQENLKKSPFYQNLWQSGQEFPLMNKAKFMENFDAINTVGIQKEEAFKLALESEKSRDFNTVINGISIGLSSGTSGNKGIFLSSKKEMAIWIGAVLDRVIGFSLKERKVAFFLRANNNLYESVKSGLLTFTFFDIKTPVQQHFEKLRTFKADILVAQPSVLFEIARMYEKQKISSSFSKVISVAEVLERDQKNFFEKVFKCRIDQVYQCTEGFLAYTCKKGNLHFNEDWLKIEKKYLDNSKTRFHPIITDYLRTSQPIINYELNDIIHEGKKCTCGAKSTVIDKIEGRSDDVFVFKKKGKTTLIYPDFIRRAVINATNGILNYVVAKVAENTIEVSLILKDGYQKNQVFLKVHEELAEMLRAFELEGIDIKSVPYILDQMKKFKRIKNDY